MGYPIHSNIFRDDSENSQYLREFPIQVAVLFSPGDKRFIEAFKELFVELDKITGKQVVFFAFLDPPTEWMEKARKRFAWQDYWRQKPLGFDFNDRMLVSELVRQFGLQWDDLPVLVISTNLWNMEYITTKTSPYHILSQLEKLTSIVKQADELDDLDLGDIIEPYQDVFGYPVHYHPPRLDHRLNISNFFGILEEFSASLDNPRWIETRIRNLYFQISQKRNDLIKYIDFQQRDRPLYDLPGIDGFLGEIKGDLIPFVAVQEKKAFEQNNHHRQDDLQHWLDRFKSDLEEHHDILDGLDDETYTMLNRGLRVARSMCDPDFLRPFLRGGQRQRPPLEEYSPAGIDLWKAFEREINKSIVQAFRCARTIEMPHYFSRFMPNFLGNNKIKYKINTNGRSYDKSVDINKKDWEDPSGDRHRFITMGNAYHCVEVMSGNPGEDLDNVLKRCLGTPHLPQHFMDDWKKIYEIRNPPSHSELLSREGFRKLADCVLRTENLEILMKIKQDLSN